MSRPIEDDLGRPATDEEIAAAGAEMAAEGGIPRPQEPANVVSLPDLAAAQAAAFQKAAFDDFRPTLDAATLEARDALTAALQGHVKAAVAAADAKAKRQKLAASRRAILDDPALGPDVKAKKLALIRAEGEVWGDAAEKADAGLGKAAKGLAPAYGAVFDALLSEARVLRHRRYTLRVRRLWDAAAVDPDAPVGPLIEEIAGYHPDVMALHGLLFGQELERQPSPDAIEEHAERLLDKLAWIEGEKAKEAKS